MAKHKNRSTIGDALFGTTTKILDGDLPDKKPCPYCGSMNVRRINNRQKELSRWLFSIAHRDILDNEYHCKDCKKNYV